jgi:hypothetical protein
MEFMCRWTRKEARQQLPQLELWCCAPCQCHLLRSGEISAAGIMMLRSMPMPSPEIRLDISSWHYGAVPQCQCHLLRSGEISAAGIMVLLSMSMPSPEIRWDISSWHYGAVLNANAISWDQVRHHQLSVWCCATCPCHLLKSGEILAAGIMRLYSM